jgi:hypothetical protein
VDTDNLIVFVLTHGDRVDAEAPTDDVLHGVATGGVPLRVAQEAMRHADVRLTASTYTDVALLDAAGALESLPVAKQETLLAKTAEIAGEKWPRKRPLLGGKKGHLLASFDNLPEHHMPIHAPRSDTDTALYLQGNAPDGSDRRLKEKMVARRGFEPL